MKGYTIDFTTNTVVITKMFAKKAAEYGSEEFKMMNELSRNGFNIRNLTHAKSKGKDRREKPSYKRMIAYISLVEQSEVYLERYNQVYEEAKCHRNPYNRVLSWFNQTFPNYGNLPELDDNGKVIVVPEKHDAKELKLA